jgi:DNA-binding FrmR family transcriptional regulator
VAHGYHGNKEDLRARLNRIEGQVRGIGKMVEEDKYCIDILTQISAINSGMKKVAVALLDDHMRHCVADAVSGDGDRGDAMLHEATQAIERLLKT